MTLRDIVRKFLQRRGYDVVRLSDLHPASEQTSRFLRERGITLVLDIGGNTGQYGRYVRDLGYRGRILSYEPSSEAFTALREAARSDPLWTCYQCALGAEEGSAILNLAGNSLSSSLLEMLPLHAAAAPGSTYRGTESTPVRTVDTEFRKHRQQNDRVFLKIDTQGYEGRVLAGARDSLPHLEGIEVEMSLVHLYKDDALLPEIVTGLHTGGFSLVALEPVFFHPVDGRLLQVNGVFFRLPSDERPL